MPGNALVTPNNIEIERLNNYKIKVAEISTNINNRSINKIEGQDSIKIRIISAVCKSLGKQLYLTPKNVEQKRPISSSRNVYRGYGFEK